MKERGPSDPDKMGFLEHLEELRVRLIRAVIAVVVALGVSWFWSKDILHFMMQPLRAAHPGVCFITTGPTESFVLHMKAALFAGVFLAAPFVLYQIWAFISPGLYSHEKRYVVPFVMFGSLFFATGGAFGHVVMFPATFRFLAQFTGGDIEYLPRLTEYFSFYFWFVVGLGTVFQLPVIIFILSRIGLVTPGGLLRNFKYAVLAAFVVSAIITPSMDVVNQTMVATPIIALYLLGIGVAWLFGRPRSQDGSNLVVLALGAVATTHWSQRAAERGVEADKPRPAWRLAA
jgi:sec-independent protein translocase protein TatC